MAWAVTEAKAKLSEVLDRAESSGLQVVTRRKREFVVMTREELDKRCSATAAETQKPFLSAWDAMKPSFDERYDIDFPRSKGKSRPVRFE